MAVSTPLLRTALHRAFGLAAGGALAGLLLLAAAPPDALGQARYSAEVGVDPALFQDMQYRLIGPARGGRVTAVAGHPATPHTFYMGAVGGGVWKTTDAGKTWRNVSGGDFKSPSIGAIDVANSDTSVVYVGTGTDGLRSNILVGAGVYKTTDGGESWTYLGLEEAGQIGAVIVHPQNPEVAYVAAIGHPFEHNPMRGVFRTTDGGATWEKVLFISDSVGVADLEFKPGHPNVIYATAWRTQRKPWTIISGLPAEAGGGIYRSTDGGDTWAKVTTGLPQGLIGKIDLAVSRDAPNRVYALVEAPEPKEGLYRSDDSGRTWHFVEGGGKDGLMTRPFYFTNLTASPADADVLYVGNVGRYKSTDGGHTWERFPSTHADHHALWINPEDPDIMVEGNDGGATVSLNGGESWSTTHNQPTAELYQVDVDDRFVYRVCAGQQDWSTICVPSLPPDARPPASPVQFWSMVAGCESGPAVPKPGAPWIVFGNCKGRFSVYNRKSGQEKNYWVGAEYMYGHKPNELEYRFQRVAPIEVSPHDPDVIYHASQYLHRTENGGLTWETISPDLTATPPGTQVISGGPITRDITGEEFYSTLYSVQVSPHEPGVIWVGSNDGLFHLTRDGGQTWTDVTPEAIPPGGRVAAIEPSPHDPGTAYYAVVRRKLGDFTPYLYRTEDYGETWMKITSGLPAGAATRVVREDPEREGLLYVGTEAGMFISFDDGAHWQSFQLNMPNVPVTGIAIHRGDLVLSTMGRSFWILDDLSPLRQASPEIAASRAHLFRPTVAWRMRYRFSSDAPADPEYPPAGAMINYWLGEEIEGEVTLEILNAEGEVIRGFSSDSAGYAVTVPARFEMRAPRTVRVGEERLETSAGMHRFVWDLERPGPWSVDSAGTLHRSGWGPMVVPGTYRVRLTVGDWSQMQPLAMKLDPRVKATGVTHDDLEEQLALNLKIRKAITEARLAAARIERAQARLENEEHPDAQIQAARRNLARLEAQIVTDPEDEVQAYPEPMLIDQLEYLYGMTTQADQEPGRDAHVRYRELRSKLDRLLGELEQVAIPSLQ